MQTELLTLIFEEAKKQCESKNDSVGLGAMCKFCSNGTPILKSAVHSF